MNLVRSIVTLTPSESKRLIAKAITTLPEVRHAYEAGIIGLPLCSTNAYVYEELTGKRLEDRSTYCCGYISSKGFCCVNEGKVHPEIVLVRGVEEQLRFPTENLMRHVIHMGPEDVVVKSGNILDAYKRAAVLVGEPHGGEFGQILPYILAKGIKLIVPMTLNKSAPVSIDTLIPEMGIGKICAEMSHGMACGMLPMPGRVVTEVEALAILTGTSVTPAAMSGLGAGEGCVTLLLAGRKEQVMKGWQLVQSIKGEQRFEPPPRNCSACSVDRAGTVCPIKEKTCRRL